MPVTKDVFCNQAYLKVIESSADTLTFAKLLTGTSIYEKVGWIISRIDYWVIVDASNFAATNDIANFGLSTSDQISAVGLDKSPVIDVNKIARVDFGTAGTGFMFRLPITKDFSSLPGGGLLVPPNPLFIFVLGANAPGAFTIEARMFYTVKMLKVEDYWELVELRHMIGA